jgi:dihydrolipoamide dehydrogenase
MPEPYAIKMPQLSDTMTEGVVVSWEKKPGDKIARGDIVATIETDKAIMDVEVFREGYLSGPLAPVDSVVPVGDPIGYLVYNAEEVKGASSEGADAKQASAAREASDSTAQPAPVPVRTEEVLARPTPGYRPPPVGEYSAPAPRPDNRRASPYARKLAGQLAVNLNTVTGTGAYRMIVADDVLRAQPMPRASSVVPLTPPHQMPEVQVPGEGRPMTAMERAVSLNMTAALTMPTFNMTVLVRPEALMRAAKTLGVSFTVAIAKACAVAIQRQPTVNWCYQPVDRIVERDYIDIGMAVATEGGGLVAPVLRSCHTRGLAELNVEWKELVERARQRRLKQEEYTNSTFQISNLGMYGVAQFNAIPMPGLGAILAISAQGANGMPLTITADHRVINGAQAAQFLSFLKESIEHPDRWLGPLGPAIPEGAWDYQVVVIGGGPGGEDCARELAGHGLRVAMINDSRYPGGECLWRGCIPSKTWRAAADRIRDRAHDARLGVERTDRPRFNWSRLEATRRQILEQRGELALKTDTGVKVKLIQGHASFESEHQLFVDFSANSDDPHRRPEPGDRLSGERISFGAAVIATGAPPVIPPIPGVQEGLSTGGVLTSDSVWGLQALPKRLLIVGAGAIGLEMAQMFRDFGAKVTVIEALPRILSEADAEIAAALQAILQGESNLALHISAKIEAISGKPGRMRLIYRDAEGIRHSVRADYVLMATGKHPQLESLNLAAAGVESTGGVIKTDARGRTSMPHIFAAGDVVGGLMLAHTAAQQGRVAAAAILGEDMRYDQSKDCGVIFTRPQAAFVGLSIEPAKARGIDAVEVKMPMELDAKAMITGETQGLIKMVVDRQSHRVVGVHFLCDHADSLIGEAVMMVAGNMNLQQIAGAIHPHPTQTELFGDMARRLLSRLRRSTRVVGGARPAMSQP